VEEFDALQGASLLRLERLGMFAAADGLRVTRFGWHWGRNWQGERMGDRCRTARASTAAQLARRAVMRA